MHTRAKCKFNFIMGNPVYLYANHDYLTLAPYTSPVRSLDPVVVEPKSTFWLSNLLKVMALMLRLARTASLSAIEGSSTVEILADKMTHMSGRGCYKFLCPKALINQYIEWNGGVWLLYVQIFYFCGVPNWLNGPKSQTATQLVCVPPIESTKCLILLNAKLEIVTSRLTIMTICWLVGWLVGLLNAIRPTNF